MDVNIEYKLKRVAENLFLDQNERDKLFEIYPNSNPEIRDIIYIPDPPQKNQLNFFIHTVYC
jgi:hypothetical protein